MKKVVLVVILFLFILAIAGLGYYYYNNQKTPPTPPNIDFLNEELKIKLTYPATYVETKLSETHKKANIIFRATRSNPDALISIKYEKGLGVLASLGGTVMDNLVNAVNRQYPKRFPEYKKTKYEKSIVGNEDASLFEFTYLGTDSTTRMKQRLIIVVKDNTAFYLSFQSPESEFEKSIQDFDKIEASFSFL